MTGQRAYWPDYCVFIDSVLVVRLTDTFWAPYAPRVREGDHDIIGLGPQSSHGVWRERSGILVRERIPETVEEVTWGQIKASFR
jgi:hypothetical protein